MQSRRDRYEHWLTHKYTGRRNAEDERALLAAADAFDNVRREGHLSPDRLAVVVAAASHPHGMRWQNAVDLLGPLAADFPEAVQAIERMSTAKAAHVRYAALCCLGRGVSQGSAVAILRAALRDRSGNVRRKAAEVARTLRAVELIPAVATAQSEEPNRRIRDSIEFSLRLLWDGYIVERRADGRVYVTANRPTGVASRSFTAAMFEAKGLAAIVAELAREPWDG